MTLLTRPQTYLAAFFFTVHCPVTGCRQKNRIALQFFLLCPGCHCCVQCRGTPMKDRPLRPTAAPHHAARLLCVPVSGVPTPWSVHNCTHFIVGGTRTGERSARWEASDEVCRLVWNDCQLVYVCMYLYSGNCLSRQSATSLITPMMHPSESGLRPSLSAPPPPHPQAA